MLLEPIISQLRTYCPTLGQNVAGAVQFKGLEEATSIPLPFAFVLPMDDAPGEGRSQNDVLQTLVEAFAVVVALDNKPDEKGQGSADAVHNMRAEIWKALLGWQLNNPDRYSGIEYQGGTLLKLDRARIWYQFEFGAYTEIGQADGWQDVYAATLPAFQGATVKVDEIDPAHDPNLAPAGQPDGRIESQFSIPQTGSLP